MVAAKGKANRDSHTAGRPGQQIGPNQLPGRFSAGYTPRSEPSPGCAMSVVMRCMARNWSRSSSSDFCSVGTPASGFSAISTAPLPKLIDFKL